MFHMRNISHGGEIFLLEKTNSDTFCLSLCMGSGEGGSLKSTYILPQTGVILKLQLCNAISDATKSGLGEVNNSNTDSTNSNTR